MLCPWQRASDSEEETMRLCVLYDCAIVSGSVLLMCLVMFQTIYPRTSYLALPTPSPSHDDYVLFLFSCPL